MFGNHLIAHWSKTQVGIALSSGEAELNASLKAAAEGLNVANMLCDLGEHVMPRIYGDSVLHMEPYIDWEAEK